MARGKVQQVAQERKAYMRDHYGKFWLTARERVYGFPVLNRSICDHICAHTEAGGWILDVGIGTGYPHASYLDGAGFRMHGVDISPPLIEKCNRLYPGIRARVADAEDLPYSDEYFDCVYSISSTMYFPDVPRAVTEMVRVAKRGGLIVFDLRNANNEEIQTWHREALRRRNTLRGYILGLGVLILKRRWPNWKSVVIESPSRPEDIYKLLDSLSVTSYRVATAIDEHHPMKIRTELRAFEEYRAILLIVTK